MIGFLTGSAWRIVVWLLVTLLCVGILPATGFADSPAPLRRVNAPYFDGGIVFSEMAVFWYGAVRSDDNSTDVRVGYNDERLRVRVAIVDRLLWYDPTPAEADLDAWDTISLYLDVNGNGGASPASDDYRFVAQLNWWEARDNFQAVYRGNESAWEQIVAPAYSATSGWRGNAPNDATDDRGWVIDFQIPFTSLGMAGPPADGAQWRMALVTHDRDNAAGTPAISDSSWPEQADIMQPDSWGELLFNPPAYVPPAVTETGTTLIRHNLGGAQVPDAAVGGSTVCGDGVDFWTEWGDTSEGFYHPARDIFNIQNLGDVGDWPCFSRYYVTFPLDALPAGKAIISATLTLHQFGNAGAPGEAQPSLIQVLTVAEDWDEMTLTWNNAPMAVENVSAAWAMPLLEFAGWPGIPIDWDLSGAVADAYAAGKPLRLALYEADGAYHSGKYFSASNAEEWNAVARPTLSVLWGAVESGDAMLSGQIALQGRPPAPDPRWATDLVVSLTVAGESTPRYSFTPTTSESGRFDLGGIEPDTYEIRIRNAHSLVNARTVALVPGLNAVDFGALREGDANLDNYVTLLDFSSLSTAFGLCASQPGYDAQTDFNEDGCTTILDFSLLSLNFAQAGD